MTLQKKDPSSLRLRRPSFTLINKSLVHYKDSYQKQCKDLSIHIPQLQSHPKSQETHNSPILTKSTAVLLFNFMFHQSLSLSSRFCRFYCIAPRFEVKTGNDGPRLEGNTGTAPKSLGLAPIWLPSP